MPPKGAESLTDLAKRCADFMQDICHRPELEEKTILIATHGAATRGLLNSLAGLEDGRFLGRKSSAELWGGYSRESPWTGKINWQRILRIM